MSNQDSGKGDREVYHKRRDAFRFKRLDQKTSDRVLQLEPSATVRKSRKEKDRFVVSFWLEEAKDYSWLESFIQEHQVKRQEYDFFISLVTESDSEIIAVPDYVQEMFKALGGDLLFSFTVV